MHLNCKMFHPELVVQDALDGGIIQPEDAERLRYIMLRRGVNKALLQRRMFIDLKHRVKVMLKEEPDGWFKRWLNKLNEELQGIAKIPRYVVWPNKYTKLNKCSPVVMGRRL